MPLVFAVSKLGAVLGRGLPASAWTPVTLFWQDAAVVIGYWVLTRVVRARRVALTAYVVLVALAAVNAPVLRVLSTPLTASMLRATRGVLLDSIAHEATPANVTLMLAVLGIGFAAPFVLRVPLRAGRALLGAGVALVLAGPFAARRADAAGLDRQPLVALVRSAFPRVRPAATSGNFRLSPWGGDASGGAGAGLSRLSGAAAGRDVLLVVLESAGARYLRPWGFADDPMPALTALTARAIVFENAYVVYPESVKGLIATLASRFPAFDVPTERQAAATSPSLSSVLAGAGYRTALFHSGRFGYLGMDSVLARAGFATLADAGDIGGNRGSSFGVDEVSAVRRILAWIDSLPPGRRFFVTYLPIAGHHPYAYGEGPYPDSTALGRYLNAIHEGDAALAVLLDGLRVRGRERSTLVVVAGDHGEAFGQHEGNFGHTLALYEENVHVPLVVAGLTDSTIRVRSVASLADLAPTVLDLLGMARPAAFQGASLLDGVSGMALFFTDYSLGLLGARDGCTKVIHELESGRTRLFDVCDDPDERVDRSADLPERASWYRDRLRAWSSAEVARITAGRR